MDLRWSCTISIWEENMEECRGYYPWLCRKFKFRKSGQRFEGFKKDTSDCPTGWSYVRFWKENLLLLEWAKFVAKENAWICFTISPTTPSTTRISALRPIMLSSLANRSCRSRTPCLLSMIAFVALIDWPWTASYRWSIRSRFPAIFLVLSARCDRRRERTRSISRLITSRKATSTSSFDRTKR